MEHKSCLEVAVLLSSCFSSRIDVAGFTRAFELYLINGAKFSFVVVLVGKSSALGLDYSWTSRTL